MAHVIEWVDIINKNGNLERLSKADLNFSYRQSAISQAAIVVQAGLVLNKQPIEEVMEQRAQALSERRLRQPLTQPSAGSVFKNPSTEKTAGWLIEQCGLKGYVIGDVEISSKHANWIVNPQKKGTAQQVLDLIQLCQERVEHQFQLTLKPELVLLS
jgi:UDP-N-acetylmuramate dehydrogenase